MMSEEEIDGWFAQEKSLLLKKYQEESGDPGACARYKKATARLRQKYERFIDKSIAKQRKGNAGILQRVLQIFRRIR